MRLVRGAPDPDDADDTVRYRDDVASPLVHDVRYVPPTLRQRFGALELTLRVPASSTVTLTYTVLKHMLHYDEHVPDAHRGRDWPPAMFWPTAGGVAWREVHAAQPVADVQPARMYAPPSLLEMAVPDFSMPYNIILFYSTLAALFIGNLLNTMLRRYRDVYREVGAPAT